MVTAITAKYYQSMAFVSIENRKYWNPDESQDVKK